MSLHGKIDKLNENNCKLFSLRNEREGFCLCTAHYDTESDNMVPNRLRSWMLKIITLHSL